MHLVRHILQRYVNRSNAGVVSNAGHQYHIWV